MIKPLMNTHGNTGSHMSPSVSVVHQPEILMHTNPYLKETCVRNGKRDADCKTKLDSVEPVSLKNNHFEKLI